MSTKTQKLTFEEWRNLPETKQRYEIVDGVMYMPPGPNVDYQGISQHVNLRLANYVYSQGLGLVFTAPLDVLVQREPLRTRQPDLLYVNAERTGIRQRSDYIGMNFLELPPNIVVEVLPPSNTRHEMDAKLRDYQKIGVYECWVFSPEAETAEVVDLRSYEPGALAVFSIEDTLISDLLPGFELNLREVSG